MNADFSISTIFIKYFLFYNYTVISFNFLFLDKIIYDPETYYKNSLSIFSSLNLNIVYKRSNLFTYIIYIIKLLTIEFLILILFYSRSYNILITSYISILSV